MIRVVDITLVVVRLHSLMITLNLHGLPLNIHTLGIIMYYFFIMCAKREHCLKILCEGIFFSFYYHLKFKLIFTYLYSFKLV
jgi:hypothetical protein